MDNWKLETPTLRSADWHKLTPLYASFHEDDHTFSLMWMAYQERFSDFYAAYLAKQKGFGTVHGVLPQPQTPPPANAYTVSCIPWVQFQHFAVHSYENKPYYFPSVEAGQFFERDGRALMPLSLTCLPRHRHVSRFLENLQTNIVTFAQYL